MSKGSAQRPGDRQKYAENWERIFGGEGRLTVGHYASHPNTGASLIDARPSPCGECERLRAENATLRNAQKACETCDAPRVAEIERLRGQVSALTVERDTAQAMIGSEAAAFAASNKDETTRLLRRQVERLRAENEAYRKDAERWREHNRRRAYYVGEAALADELRSIDKALAAGRE